MIQFILAAIGGVLFTIGIRIWMEAMAYKVKENDDNFKLK